MQPEAKEELRVRLKLVVLELAAHLGVTKACREFNVPRSSFYRWKQKYEKAGQSGLYRERPIAYRRSHRTTPEVIENPGTPKGISIWSLTDHVLPGALSRDQDFRIHGQPSLESP